MPHRKLRPVANPERFRQFSQTLDVGKIRPKERAERRTHDSLTGLSTRPALAAKYRELAERDGTMMLLVIDIDGFKSLNDTYGHPVGDLLLVALAKRAREVLGALVQEFDLNAAEIFRIGGDEFVILAQGWGLADQAQAVVTGFYAAMTTQSYSLEMNVAEVVSTYTQWLLLSIGVTVCDAQMPYEEAYSQADSALLHVRTQRSASWHIAYYTPSIGDEIRSYKLIIDRIQRALRNESFILKFQPIMRRTKGGTREPAALEVLARLIDEDGIELENTEDIFHKIEFLGITGSLVRPSLQRASAMYLAWLAVNPNVRLPRLNLNISAEQLHNPQEFSLLLAAVSELDPRVTGLLVLEITERTKLINTPEVHDRIALMLDMGVVFALDDFGEGNANLVIRAQFPEVAMIKFSKELLGPLKATRKTSVKQLDAAETRYYYNLRNLAALLNQNTSVVLEGIETPALLKLVGSWPSLRYLQGYALGRPITRAELEATYNFIRPSG